MLQNFAKTTKEKQQQKFVIQVHRSGGNKITVV